MLGSTTGKATTEGENMSADIGPQDTGQPLPPSPAGWTTPAGWTPPAWTAQAGQTALGPVAADEQGRSLHRRRRRAIVASTATAALLAAAGGGYALNSHGSEATGTTSSSTLSVAQLEAKVAPAVVDVVSTLDYGAGEAAGTGIVLTSNGEVLTNNHVVEGATNVRVTDVGNGKTYTATVVGYDFTYDVAVLQLKGASGLATADLGNSSSVAEGQSVVALGNAGGRGGTPSSATGTITALGESITAYDEATGSSEQLTGLIETSADIQSGDSGGPLVNMSGEVIGMDTAASSSFQFQGPNGEAGGTQGYAIPINEAAAIAKQIEAGHASSTVHVGASAFLGVQLASTSSFLSNGFGSTGATIAGVVSGSPAASAGLSAGDTITSVGGHAVTSPASLRSLLTRYYPGDKVSVSWVDQFGANHAATLKLAGGPTG
jgi:S1-C subfamily serine protease